MRWWHWALLLGGAWLVLRPKATASVKTVTGQTLTTNKSKTPLVTGEEFVVEDDPFRGAKADYDFFSVNVT